MKNLSSSSERRLKASGKRITPQRKLVLNILDQASGHLDATEIYERGRKEDTRLSLATVYRTLSMLKEMGMVRELHLDDEHHHYELDDRDGHSHLVCLKCGRVIEVDSSDFVAAARLVGAKHNFSIQGAQVELNGTCAACQIHRKD